MNFYKKIIKSRNLRVSIIRLFNFIPDKPMLKIQYRLKTGRKLHLKNPQRYTEKIQWYKLYYRTDLLTRCSDKYAVRRFVEERGLGHILNDLYAVYDTPDQVEWDSLPQSFAMKANNGSGTNYFVSDKKNETADHLRDISSKWFRNMGHSLGREWCYVHIPPKLIFEKLLPRDKNNDLPDYKFFCFDGKVYCLYTMIDYTDNHANGKLGFFDRDFNQMPYRRLDYNPITSPLEKPANFDLMVEYAETLAAGFPHVRVDFYNIDGQIVFGEMTFYNASGYTLFEPDAFDRILGDQFVLPEKTIPSAAD
ncbi:MAG: ATP-grasp fold amidoligase family protein [Candidatus Howiella sp.]|jgi:hypothetical protein